MKSRRSLLFALAVTSALAPLATADGREPGSLLVYPIQEQRVSDGPIFEDGKSQVLAVVTLFNVVSVTNTQRAGSGTTDVHFQYVNVDPTGSPFLFANCSISDRVETLTPADTLSVLTSCHNGAGIASGYLVLTARDPDLVDTPWSFNHLIGSEQVVTAGGAMFALNAIPFRSPQAYRAPTDLDGDDSRDFDDLEYERLPDELYLDSYIGVLSGELILLAFTGPEYLTNVDFIIYNDDEFQLSAQFAFACWTRAPLALISGFFTNAGLSTTNNDTRELDITCDGVQDLETGWAIIRPRNALSITSPQIDDPAVLGATTFPTAPWLNGRLLWESQARQANASFPN